MARKYRLANYLFTSSDIHAFVKSAERFAEQQRRAPRQVMKVLKLFWEPDVRSEVPWKEIHQVLGWHVDELGLSTRRSTLVDNIKGVCFAMSSAVDPLTHHSYNDLGVCVTARRGAGLTLQRFTHVGKQSFDDAINQAIAKRAGKLTQLANARSLPKRDRKEFNALRRYLGKDSDLPAEMIGPYRLVREVGRGSTGRVYQARNTYVDEVVALKILNWDLADELIHRTRFFRGAKAMMGLQHPNIAKVVNAAIDKGIPYYAAEFVDGGTLASLIEGDVSTEERLRILEGVIAALAHAHGAGIIHRDLKPENILVDARLSPKVTDFDCAYLPTLDPVQTRTLHGTLRYMSPERLRDMTFHNPDDDVYAVGVIALELLTRRRYVPVSDLLSEIAANQQLRRFQPIILGCVQPSHLRYADAKPLSSDWHAVLSSSVDITPEVPVHIVERPAPDYANRDLRGHVFDRQFLPRVNFRGAGLEGASFRQCVLSNAVFMRADIRGCCFDGAFMLSARMQDARASGATFRHADLERTVWDGVDLTDVDFQGANFWGTFLRKALNIEKASLGQANFSRNWLADDQESLIRSLPNVTFADNYGELYRRWLERHPEGLPGNLWWVKLFSEKPELILRCY